MRGFMVVRISAVVGGIVGAVVFYAYVPPVPEVGAQRLASQENRLGEAAEIVMVRGDRPDGWWRAAGAIRRSDGQRAQEAILEQWLGTLSSDVLDARCAEGLVRARMAMQAQPGWGISSLGRGSMKDEQEAAAQFDTAIEVLERWREERTADLFHLYTLGVCYRASGRGEEAGVSGGVLDVWRDELARVGEELDMAWRVRVMTHLALGYEDAARVADAAGVYREIGRVVVETGHKGNSHFNGPVDRVAEVVEKLLALGDVEGAEATAALGHGEGGENLNIWAWRDTAWALDDGGRAGAAAQLRGHMLARYEAMGAGERDQTWWYAVAQLRSMLGWSDGAVEALGRALELAEGNGDSGWSTAAVDKELDGVRGHPGYAALEARYGGKGKGMVGGEGG